jgi:hypothetical protein
MAGITNAPFRRLCRGFGPGGLYVSEMITARGVASATTRPCPSPASPPTSRCARSSSTGPSPRGRRGHPASWWPRRPADHIDLNFGCPVPKVTRKGGGAALPVASALFRSSWLPRSARRARSLSRSRCASGIDGLHTYLDAGRIAEAEGAAAVPCTPHRGPALLGRADWSRIARLQGGGDDRAGAGQRRHLAGRRRPAHAGRDRLRRRGRRPAAAWGGRGCSGPGAGVRGRASPARAPAGRGRERAVHTTPGCWPTG